jgi:hypothetical protein
VIWRSDWPNLQYLLPPALACALHTHFLDLPALVFNFAVAVAVVAASQSQTKYQCV